MAPHKHEMHSPFSNYSSNVPLVSPLNISYLAVLCSCCGVNTTLRASPLSSTCNDAGAPVTIAAH